MIDTILSVISSIWKPVASIGGMVAAIFFLWRRNKKQAERLERQDRVISTYKAKEEIHRQDQEKDAATNQQVNDLREQVEDAVNEEEAAGAVSNALNRYFGDPK